MSKDGQPVDGFATYLADAIERAGFDKPTPFARAAGIDPSVVFRWLSGEQRPTARLLERVAPVLKVPVADLIAMAYPSTAAPVVPPDDEDDSRYTDPATGEVYVDPDERKLWDLRRIAVEERRELIAFLRVRRGMRSQRRAAG